MTNFSVVFFLKSYLVYELLSNAKNCLVTLGIDQEHFIMPSVGPSEHKCHIYRISIKALTKMG